MKSMSESRLEIQIERPIDVVFGFTINPMNTPRWLRSVKKERTSSNVIERGTEYYQIVEADDGTTHEVVYVVTALEENRLFELHRANSTYWCSYTYEEIPAGTRLIYREEATANESLDDLDDAALRMLKYILESE